MVGTGPATGINRQTKIPALMIEYILLGEGKILSVCRERIYKCIYIYIHTVNMYIYHICTYI